MDVLGVLNFVLSVFIGLFILVVLVVLHELGHALVARRNGVNVEEFGVGFPPLAWGKKVKKSFLGDNVFFSINWLPLGGFVKLQGEHDAATKKGDYGHASLWAKTKILLAGVAINWITAAVLLGILAVVGLPKLIDGQFTMPGDTIVDTQPTTVTVVAGGLPAEKAGVRTGDELVSLAGVSLDDVMKLSQTAKDNKGKVVDLVYRRGGEQKTVAVDLRDDNTDGKGYLGLTGGQKTTYRSTWSAPIVGVALTGQFTVFTFQSLGEMLVKFVTGLVQKISFSSEIRTEGDKNLGDVSNNVGGPIAILGMFFPQAREAGLMSLTLATALISLTLAVMNFLPIPALDGGRWFVTMLYRVILRKPLTKEKEEKIHGTGMMVLLGLFVLITVADIGKLGR